MRCCECPSCIIGLLRAVPLTRSQRACERKFSRAIGSRVTGAASSRSRITIVPLIALWTLSW